MLSDTLLDELPVIIVMPFSNKTGNQENQYICEGISEAISSALTHFSTISVISYYSALYFNDQQFSIADIITALKVDFLVIGSIYQSEHHYRLSIQLIESKQQEQIWAKKVDFVGGIDTILTENNQINNHIAALIASREGIITQKLWQNHKLWNEEKMTTYKAILRAQFYLKNCSKNNHLKAIQSLENVVKNDPNCAKAWALLGMCYDDDYILKLQDHPNAFQLGKEACYRGLDLQVNCQDVQLGMAMTYLLTNLPNKTIQAAHKVIDLNPNAAYQVGTAGWFIALAGNWLEGIEIINDSIKLNPFYPQWFHLPCFLWYYQQKEYELALVEADQFAVPDFFWTYILYTVIYVKLDQEKKTKDNYQTLLKLKPDFISNIESYLNCYIINDELRQNIINAIIN